MLRTICFTRAVRYAAVRLSGISTRSKPAWQPEAWKGFQNGPFFRWQVTRTGICSVELRFRRP